MRENTTGGSLPHCFGWALDSQTVAGSRAHRLLHATGAAWNTNAWSVDRSTLSTIELLNYSGTKKKKKTPSSGLVLLYLWFCVVVTCWKCQAPLETTKGALDSSSKEEQPAAELLVAIVFNHSTGKKR
uniref:Uncharacterized protein n=1 Tax=Daphnia galeata TaxID=27404 RepID=A0A8J2WE24_9CRUS|nr:unnamed protein product [Daphnia galeata]